MALGVMTVKWRGPDVGLCLVGALARKIEQGIKNHQFSGRGICTRGINLCGAGGGGIFGRQKHGWCGNWRGKDQKRGFTGVNTLIGEWCEIFWQSFAPIISAR